jgi:phytoene/squalene synthetase
MRVGADPDFSLMPELFPARLRPHLRAFGRFVRLADATTDDAFLTTREKVARLATLESALEGAAAPQWSVEARAIAEQLRESLLQTGVPPEHLQHILQAFRGDATGHVSETWGELMLYCRFAAAPVGRYMLQLAGEDLQRCSAASDALCAALRILKQLRDCKDPAVQYNRLCIPRAFLDDAMITPAHLRVPSAKGQVRAVIDRVLDGVDRLLDEAAPLPALIRDNGLATHAAIVLCRARKLVRRFRRRDPLRERVGLARWQRALCRWIALLRVLPGRGRTTA